MPTTCSRCQRVDERPFAHDWSDSAAGPVCPDCELAAWHPHCLSLVDSDGHRVDTSTIPADEWQGVVDRCDFIDESVIGFNVEAPPTEWVCPKCGGTEFELVHPDYNEV
jgi:hypothetical protein